MPFQNLYLSNHPKHILTLEVENIVGTKRKIKESESEAGLVTIDKFCIQGPLIGYVTAQKK